MKLEEELRNARFRNIRHRAVSNILYTHSNVALRLQKMLNEYSLTIQQYNILRILQRQHPNPACNCTIREQMLDANSDITRIVDRLIKEELVERNNCHLDRRKVSISLTYKGLCLLDEMSDLQDKMECVVGSLTDEELQELSRLLDKVRDQSETELIN